MTGLAEFRITTLKSQFRGISNLITIDRRVSKPLYQQIYDSFRSRIIRGELRAGDLVPSSRELARESRISRLPVLTAYAQLLAVGTWKTRVRRLLNPLSGSNDWIEGTGTVSTRKVWGGRAQLEELTMDTGDTHLKGLALRLYNPKTRQWRLHWANATKGVLSDQPAFGAFKNGRGEF